MKIFLRVEDGEDGGAFVNLYNDFTEVGRDACEDAQANWQKLVDIGWGAN